MPLSCATDLLAGRLRPRELSTVCDAAHHPFLEPLFSRDAAPLDQDPAFHRTPGEIEDASVLFLQQRVRFRRVNAGHESLLWTPTHMLPFSRKAIPPNIFFSTSPFFLPR